MKAAASKAAKRVAKDNARFRKMTAAEKRVAIAQDVIAWVKAGALVPSEGGYVCPSNGYFAGMADRETQLRDVNLGQCEVCAVGALFLAKAVRFDACTVGDWRSGQFHDNLTDHFSEEQIALIECAFECCRMGPFYNLPSDEDSGDALAFYRRYRTDKGRLIAIMQNIIDHDGQFVPGDH